MMVEFFSINYFLILDDEDSSVYSPFCGFALNLLSEEKNIRKILQLPTNVLELQLSATQKFLHRLGSPVGHNILPVNYSSFSTIPIDLSEQVPFSVIIYDKKKQPNIQTVVSKWKFKPILLDKNDDWNEKQLDPFIQVYDKLYKANSDVLPQGYGELKIDENIDTNIVINDSVLTHGIVAPIYNVLEYNGVVFTNMNPFFGAQNNKTYESLIINANNIFKQVTDKIEKWIHKKYHPKFDAVFASPPLYSMHSLDSYFEGFKPKQLRDALHSFVMQKDYFVMQNIDEQINSKNKPSQEFMTAGMLRRTEMMFYWVCLELVFERYWTKLFRISQGVQSDVNQETQALRYSSPKKKNASFRKLINKVNQYVVEDFRKELPINKIPSIKIYSDAPIEFATDIKNNLPFLVSTKMCKIPITPGNVFFGYLSNSKQIFISQKELSKILIIRSFNYNDPIRSELEETIQSYQRKEKFNLDIIFEDVSSVKELLKVRNKHLDCNIVIFDCHGKHNNTEWFGNLVIGNELFNIWKHRYEFHPPLIVLFSACETHPIGNNYNSVANGFLASGTRTAIATNMPVKSLDSSVFIARILLRMSMLLPVLIGFNKKSITWLDFISDFFRMSYKSEIVRYFYSHNLLNCTDKEIQFMGSDSNMNINLGNPNWFDILIERLSRFSTKSPDECKAIINRDICFTETMKYIVLGDADTINIHANE